jgi:hypothetical protein
MDLAFSLHEYSNFLGHHTERRDPMPATAVNSVSPAYVHTDKHVAPQDNIRLGRSELKWYDLAPPHSPVPDEIRALARSAIEDEYALGNLSDLGDLGFVILHRCGDEFYFLLVQSWKNENELWESIYAKKSVDHDEFVSLPPRRHHNGTFCVWELEAVLHEQKAWREFLRSDRTEIARGRYLEYRYCGET